MKKQYRIINAGKGILNITANNLHKVTEDKDVIIPNQKFITFKTTYNTNNELLQIGDSITGYVQGQFLVDATYIGGDTNSLLSYEGF